MAARRSGVGGGVLSVVEILVVIVVAFFVLRFLAAMGGAGSAANGGGIGPGGASDSIGNALRSLFGMGAPPPGAGQGSGAGSSFSFNPSKLFSGLFGNNSNGSTGSELLDNAIGGIQSVAELMGLDQQYNANEDLIDSPGFWGFDGLIPQYTQQGVDLSNFQFDPSYTNANSEGLPTDTPDNTDNYISVDDGGTDDGGDS